jgi:hypothetical protein
VEEIRGDAVHRLVKEDREPVPPGGQGGTHEET